MLVLWMVPAIFLAVQQILQYEFKLLVHKEMLLNMFEFDWIKIQMLSSTKTEIVNKYKCTMDSGQQVSH